jgi:hypothetical protein
MPPGAGPPGNYISTGFVAVDSSVAAESDCRGTPAAGVGTTPSDIATWMTRQPELVTTKPTIVSIGGLQGDALDISMKPGAKGCLSQGATGPAVPLLTGINASSFDHEVGPGTPERAYLLHFDGGTLAIEAVDPSGGSHLSTYEGIVQNFRFSS